MEFDKLKVYSAANADEVKIGSKGYFADTLSELKKCVFAGLNYGEVKNIENKDKGFRFLDNESTCWDLFYLAEELKGEDYRPYENAEEMIEDFKERFNIFTQNYAEPLILVKEKGKNLKILISIFKEKEQDGQQITLVYNGNCFISLDTLFITYTYLDGSPCGKKIQQDISK